MYWFEVWANGQPNSLWVLQKSNSLICKLQSAIRSPLFVQSMSWTCSTVRSIMWMIFLSLNSEFPFNNLILKLNIIISNYNLVALPVLCRFLQKSLHHDEEILHNHIECEFISVNEEVFNDAQHREDQHTDPQICPHLTIECIIIRRWFRLCCLFHTLNEWDVLSIFFLFSWKKIKHTVPDAETRFTDNRSQMEMTE